MTSTVDAVADSAVVETPFGPLDLSTRYKSSSVVFCEYCGAPIPNALGRRKYHESCAKKIKDAQDLVREANKRLRSLREKGAAYLQGEGWVLEKSIFSDEREPEKIEIIKGERYLTTRRKILRNEMIVVPSHRLTYLPHNIRTHTLPNGELVFDTLEYAPKCVRCLDKDTGDNLRLNQYPAFDEFDFWDWFNWCPSCHWKYLKYQPTLANQDPILKAQISEWSARRKGQDDKAGDYDSAKYQSGSQPFDIEQRVYDYIVQKGVLEIWALSPPKPVVPCHLCKVANWFLDLESKPPYRYRWLCRGCGSEYYRPIIYKARAGWKTKQSM